MKGHIFKTIDSCLLTRKTWISMLLPQVAAKHSRAHCSFELARLVLTIELERPMSISSMSQHIGISTERCPAKGKGAAVPHSRLGRGPLIPRSWHEEPGQNRRDRLEAQKWYSGRIGRNFGESYAAQPSPFSLLLSWAWGSPAAWYWMESDVRSHANLRRTRWGFELDAWYHYMATRRHPEIWAVLEDRELPQTILEGCNSSAPRWLVGGRDRKLSNPAMSARLRLDDTKIILD